jgi:2-polyprenyl-3-methyl-5-hydroxy-6-metoxy-1,4-benzoquinol methylase
MDRTPTPKARTDARRWEVAPKIVSTAKHNAFNALAASMGLETSDVWVGQYVDYEWNRLRFVLQAYEIDTRDLRVLEFGCNIGASTIVLAHLGAKLCAMDVSSAVMALARLNAERYGLHDIDFVCLPESRALPFSDGEFDLVVCNSVLECVQPDLRSGVQREIDRIVKVRGKILVTGTSNRL